MSLTSEQSLLVLPFAQHWLGASCLPRSVERSQLLTIMNQIKEWQLTINQQVITLTLTNQTGTCFKCQLPKTLKIISQKPVWIGTTATYQEK